MCEEGRKRELVLKLEAVTIILSAKSRLSPTATCALYASCPPELGPNKYTDTLVLITMLLGQ